MTGTNEVVKITIEPIGESKYDNHTVWEIRPAEILHPGESTGFWARGEGGHNNRCASQFNVATTNSNSFAGFDFWVSKNDPTNRKANGYGQGNVREYYDTKIFDNVTLYFELEIGGYY